MEFGEISSPLFLHQISSPPAFSLRVLNLLTAASSDYYSWCPLDKSALVNRKRMMEMGLQVPFGIRLRRPNKPI
ncbi:hypothetical protein LINPERPRIM_LOCUS38389 [Linum perenne]